MIHSFMRHDHNSSVKVGAFRIKLRAVRPYDNSRTCLSVTFAAAIVNTVRSEPWARHAKSHQRVQRSGFGARDTVSEQT